MWVCHMLMLKMVDEVFIIPISLSIHFQVSLCTHMNHTLATNVTNFFFTIINLLTVAVYTLTHTHYNNIVIVKFDAEPVSEHHANHM